jgi:hypothetical protein
VADNMDEIQLVLNVDGLPLFHASNNLLWPVLCYAANIKPHKVFVAAVCGGKSKPCILEF